jgi:hypothetical protein
MMSMLPVYPLVELGGQEQAAGLAEGKGLFVHHSFSSLTIFSTLLKQNPA